MRSQNVPAKNSAKTLPENAPAQPGKTFASIKDPKVLDPRPGFTPNPKALLRAARLVCKAGLTDTEKDISKARRACWEAITGRPAPDYVLIEAKSIDPGISFIQIPSALVKEMRPHAKPGKEPGTRKIHALITEVLREGWNARKAKASKNGGAK